MVKHDTKLITFPGHSISGRRDLCSQCLSQLYLCVRIPLTTRDTRCNLCDKVWLSADHDFLPKII